MSKEMSSTGPKAQTQKRVGSDSVANRQKSHSRSTGSETGKHVDAAATTAGLDASIKSINDPVGLFPALGHLKPEDLSCVDKPDELVFGLPYIPPVKILGFEPRLESLETTSGLDFAKTDKTILSNAILADTFEDKVSSSTYHSLPSTCYQVSHSLMPLRLTGTMPVLPDSTLHQTDMTLISPRPALPEPTTIDKFKLTDRDPSFLDAMFLGDDQLMSTTTRANSRDWRRPTSDSRRTDSKFNFPNATLPNCVNFILAGTEPAFLDPSFADTALISSRPGSPGKASHETDLALQFGAGLIVTTSAQVPPTPGVDQTQTPELQTVDQGAASLAQDATTTVQKNESNQCIGFERKSPPRHSSHPCSDCSEEEKMLMATYDFSQEQLAELMESYLYFASPGDQLRDTNFGRSLRAIGQNPSEEDIKKMLKIASVRPEDGYITLDNYLKAVGCWGLRSEVDMVEDLIQAFKIFDEEDDERLDSTKIRAALQNYAEPLDEQDVSQLLQLADNTPTCDGKLAFMSVIKAIAAHYITQDLRMNASSTRPQDPKETMLSL